MKALKEKNAGQKKYWQRLTYACNNHCLFCLDAENSRAEHVSLVEVMDGLKNGINGGCRRLVLSGGEPTLHPEFLNIIKQSKKLGYRHIQVISNGRAFCYERFLEEAVNSGLNEITFSMHGHRQQLYEKLTGIKGSFAQSLKGLTNALSVPGLIVSVDVVINKINVRELRDILDFYICLGVNEFDLLQVTPFGRAWDNWGMVGYDIGENIYYLNRAFSLSRQKGIVLWTNRFPARFLEDFPGLIQDPYKLYDEIRGREYFFNGFLESGKKIPCRGGRCKYCFLDAFCNDLAGLKEKNILGVRKKPLCMKNLLKKKAFYLTNKRKIYDFLDFFIKNRYFVKPARCRLCARFGDCDGLPVSYVKKNGYGSLKPLFRKGQNVILDIDHKCDLNCVFCTRSAITVKTGKSEFNFESNKKLLGELNKKWGISSLQIGGTEPLNYPRIIDLIGFARNSGFTKIDIQTAGLRFCEKDFIRRFAIFKEITFKLPIYGHTAELHDSVTRVKGSFVKLLNAVENIKSINHKVYLHTLILRHNYRYLDKLAYFVKDILGCKLEEFTIAFVRPRNNNAAEYRKICPSFGELADCFENNFSFTRKELNSIKGKVELPPCILVKIFGPLLGRSSLVNYYKNIPSPLCVKISGNDIVWDEVGDTDLGRSCRVFSRKCEKCVLSAACRISPGYLQAYGDAEFEPFI